MKSIDIKEFIEALGIKQALCESLAQKTNKSKEDLEKSFNDIIEKEINRIGESMQSAQSNPQDTSRLRDLSLDDFMKDNDKIIKDK
jgi:flagellar hook-basal body complex protein FliE